MILIFLLTIGCHRYSDIDYATKNCDINYKGKCYFKKRIAEKDYDEELHYNFYTNHDKCTLITPDLGCISSFYVDFQIRMNHWVILITP